MFYARESAVGVAQTPHDGCHRTKGWLAMAAQFASVITSPPTDDTTFAARQAACDACPHRQDRHDDSYCGCCGCPKWRLATLAVKNRLSRWECPEGRFPAVTPPAP